MGLRYATTSRGIVFGPRVICFVRIGTIDPHKKGLIVESNGFTPPEQLYSVV